MNTCRETSTLSKVLKSVATCAALSLASSACAFECSDAAKAKARDFIDNEKQFHLGFLPTEQSNPITATLEEDFKRSTLAGVQCLQRGDRLPRGKTGGFENDTSQNQTTRRANHE